MSLHRALACLAAGAALAAGAEVTVKEAWVRGTVPAQTSTGVFMTLVSRDGARVVEVRSSVAREAQIHSSEMHGGVAHMHALDRLELPPGKRVELKPGGHHIMLMGLKHTLSPGDRVPLTLFIEEKDRRRTLEVQAVVRPLGK